MTTAKIRVLIRYTPYSLLWWGGWRSCSISGRLGTVSGRLGTISWLLAVSGLLGSAISCRFAIGGRLSVSSGFLRSTISRLLAGILLLLFTLLGFIATLLLLFRLLRLVTALLFLLFGLLASGEGNLLGSRLTLFCLRLGHLSLSLSLSSIRLCLLLFGNGLSGFLFLDDCLCLGLLSLLLLGLGVFLGVFSLLDGILLVFLGLFHLFLFLFLCLLSLLLFHGLFPDVSGLFIRYKPVESIVLGCKFGLHFLLGLLNLSLMLAQLYLSFIVFELSLGLSLFMHFELVVDFVRLFMGFKGNCSGLVNLLFCLLLLVYSDGLLLGCLLHSLTFFLLFDGLISGTGRFLLFRLGQGCCGLLRRSHLLVCFSVIGGSLINLTSCLVKFILSFSLRRHLVLFRSGLSDGLSLGSIVRLLSRSLFVFVCADL